MEIKEEYVKTEYFVYPYYYEEFYRNFLLREKGLKYLILAGVFLHLTFENIITHHIRLFVNNVIDRYRGGSIQQYWDEVFESEDLPKKLDFLYFVILSADESCKSIIKDVKIFYNSSASLRNKLVHGHEISEKKFHNGEIEKSKLFTKLEKEKLEKLYSNFRSKLEIFLNLFILANSKQPLEERWKNEFIKEYFIEKPIRTVKGIEKKLKVIINT